MTIGASLSLVSCILLIRRRRWAATCFMLFWDIWYFFIITNERLGFFLVIAFHNLERYLGVLFYTMSWFFIWTAQSLVQSFVLCPLFPFWSSSSISASWTGHHFEKSGIWTLRTLDMRASKRLGPLTLRLFEMVGFLLQFAFELFIETFTWVLQFFTLTFESRSGRLSPSLLCFLAPALVLFQWQLMIPVIIL